METASPAPLPPSLGNSTQIPPPPMTEKDIRLWSMLCHLGALTVLLIPSLGCVAGPLVFWLLKRNEHPIIDAHGRESLNFQLSILIYAWAFALLGLATVWILIGFLFLAIAGAIHLAGLAFAIYAAVRASDGHSFRYPLTLRFL